MRQITLDGVSRVYGRTFALHRVSMTLEAGTLTALLGGNGAGKTTLLHILAALEAPSSGAVSYDAIPWARFAKSARQHVGWVSHDALVYGDLSGAENLIFYAQMYGLDDPPGLAARWLDRVGLSDAAERRVRAYSRGMLQRLSVARALLHDPSLILLDEPLTGMDRQGRRDMAEVFAELRARKKILVMSTHDLHALGGLCTHLGVLRQGTLATYQPVGSDADIPALYEQFA